MEGNKTAVIIGGDHSHRTCFTVSMSHLCNISERFAHNPSHLVRIESHVSPESMKVFNIFINTGDLQLNEATFDDLSLLNAEWKCGCDRKLQEFADRYFADHTLQRVLNAIRNRLLKENTTSDLEVRLQNAFCTPISCDLLDQSLRETVKGIGLPLFVRVFEMDNHKLVRKYLSNVFSFMTWCIESDGPFGRYGSVLFRGVDMDDLTSSQMDRLRHCRSFDTTVLENDLLEKPYRARNIDTLLWTLVGALVLAVAFLLFRDSQNRRDIDILREAVEDQQRMLTACHRPR